MLDAVYLTNTIYELSEVKNEIRKITEYLCRKLRDKKLVAGYLYFVLRYDNLRYASGDIHLDHHSNDDRILYEAALDVFKSFPQPNECLQVRMFGMGVFSLHQTLRIVIWSYLRIVLRYLSTRLIS